MVTANESQTYQQFSARNSSYLDSMAVPQLEKNYSLPYFPLPKHTPEVAFVGQSGPNLPDLNIGQQDTVGGFLNPIGTPYLKDALPYGLGSTDKAFDAPQKRFLIFDQSGNDTRLFFSPAFSHQDRIFPSKEVATRVDHPFLMKPPIVEEKWDENHLSDEEGEMLEDSDEIDALLYSDSDYDEDDEVTSTRRRQSPFPVEEGYNNDRLLDDEQVASSDESPKRQRLVDGKYKKPSLESHQKRDENDVDSNKRANKARIREALKILETIIPGLDNNDPLSIIDEAVAYLKSMKTEAEALEQYD